MLCRECGIQTNKQKVFNNIILLIYGIKFQLPNFEHMQLVVLFVLWLILFEFEFEIANQIHAAMKYLSKFFGINFKL